MSRYLDNLTSLELSRRLALNSSIARTNYQRLLQREQLLNLQRQLDHSRRLQLQRNLAIQAQISRQHELQLRLAHQRQLDLQRQLTEKAKFEQARISALNVEIEGVRRAIEAERAEQAQLHDEAGKLDIEIAELYRVSNDREREEILELERLDKEIFELQKEMRDSEFKRNAYESSIEKMTRMLA